ncbi:MAG TPA: addiction module protein [Candidatus Paceibacterota bacterium]|nr:addiction module protein [Verrucomicrobiota bacterium]HRY51299.1 addiction module protein [Candidatus Paceibacterota bacterium]
MHSTEPPPSASVLTRRIFGRWIRCQRPSPAAVGELIVRSKNALAGGRGARYSFFMTTQEIKALPVDQKIRIMEAIWEDFRDRFDRMEIPQEQKDLLDQRRARVREGKARLLDWDSVKGTLGRP